MVQLLALSLVPLQVPDYLRNAVPLFSNNDQSSLTLQAPPELATKSTSPDGTVTFNVKAGGKNPWDAQVQTPLFTAKIKKGDTLLFTYSASGEASGASYGFHVQQVKLSYRYLQGWQHSVQDGTKQFFSAFVVDSDFEPGQLEATFHFATQAQTISINSFKAWNLGAGVQVDKLPVSQLSYKGQSPNATWRAKAAEMIEKNRKSNLNVSVKDSKGKPVIGATVLAKMLSHDYRFGSFTDYVPSDPTPDGLRARQVIKQNFNGVTVPIYWADWGWEDIKVRDSYLRILDWAKAEKLGMRAHTLLYPGYQFFPSRIKAMESNPEMFRKAILEGTAERVSALNKYPFEVIDVVNELVTCTDVERVAGTGVINEMFRMAAKGWPKAKLVYNDYNIFESNLFGKAESLSREKVYERLLKDGNKIDQLGWQGHFSEALTPPEDIWNIVDHFQKKYNRPIEITEFDIDTRDEKGQADYMRDLLTAWFAHPSTVGFTNWGFWEGSMWKPNGAMFRKDWSEKPNAKVWKDLIFKQWWTNASTKTNSKGTASLRGFHGQYEIAVTSGKKRIVQKVSILPSTKNLQLVLK